MLAVMGTLKIRLWENLHRQQKHRNPIYWQLGMQQMCTDVLQFSSCSRTPAVRVSLGRTFSNQFIICV